MSSSSSNNNNNNIRKTANRKTCIIFCILIYKLQEGILLVKSKDKNWKIIPLQEGYKWSNK